MPETSLTETSLTDLSITEATLTEPIITEYFYVNPMPDIAHTRVYKPIPAYAQAKRERPVSECV